MSSVIWYLKSEVAFSQSYATSTHIGNKEQLTICIRWVDKEVEAHEDFLGFYKVPDIGVETIVSAIKDVLSKLPLSLVTGNCKGQCYDGASNMIGHKKNTGPPTKGLSYSLSWTLTQHKCKGPHEKL